jgi:hypothetical protein
MRTSRAPLLHPSRAARGGYASRRLSPCGPHLSPYLPAPNLSLLPCPTHPLPCSLAEPPPPPSILARGEPGLPSLSSSLSSTSSFPRARRRPPRATAVPTLELAGPGRPPSSSPAPSAPPSALAGLVRPGGTERHARPQPDPAPSPCPRWRGSSARARHGGARPGHGGPTPARPRSPSALPLPPCACTTPCPGVVAGRGLGSARPRGCPSARLRRALAPPRRARVRPLWRAPWRGALPARSPSGPVPLPWPRWSGPAGHDGMAMARSARAPARRGAASPSPAERLVPSLRAPAVAPCAAPSRRVAPATRPPRHTAYGARPRRVHG